MVPNDPNNYSSPVLGPLPLFYYSGFMSDHEPSKLKSNDLENPSPGSQSSSVSESSSDEDASSHSTPESEDHERVYDGPRESDVIMGRGHRSAAHPGNQRLRIIVNVFASAYAASNNEAKSEITENIIRILTTCGTAPARFMKKLEQDQGWVEVVDRDAVRNKVAQAMRFRQRAGSKKAGAEDGPITPKMFAEAKRRSQEMKRRSDTANERNSTILCPDAATSLAVDDEDDKLEALISDEAILSHLGLTAMGFPPNDSNVSVRMDEQTIIEDLLEEDDDSSSCTSSDSRRFCAV